MEGVNPQIFRVGDIVKVQVSFITVPLKDNKHKMIVMLQSIALLDASFSQVRMVVVMATHLLFLLMNAAGSIEEQNEQA